MSIYQPLCNTMHSWAPLLAVGVWFLPQHAANAACAPSQLSIDGHVDYECVKRVEAGVDMHWRLSEDQKTMALALTSKNEAGWLGITIPSVAGQMAPAKGVIGECNTTCTVHTYSVTSPGHGVPVHLDPSQHLINSSFAYENGVATLKFARVVDASAGNPIDVTGSTPFLFARAKKQLPSYHSEGQGGWTVEFVPKPTPDPSACTPSTLEISPQAGKFDCMYSLKDDMVFHWKLAADKQSVWLGLTGDIEPGWLGLSIPESAGDMGPAQAVIGHADMDDPTNTSVSTYHVWADGDRSPPVEEDDTEKLLWSSFTWENGLAVLKYHRAVNGNGGGKILPGGYSNFNYAVDHTYPIVGHKHKGSFSVNLTTGKVVDAGQLGLKVLHGVLMTVAWLVLAPLALLVKRYGVKVFKMNIRQYYFHAGAMLFVVVMTTVSVLIARGNDFSVGYHGHGTYMAVLIIVLMSLNPAIGIGGYIFVRDPNHPKRWIFSLLHKAVGYAAMLTVVIQCFYGVQSLSDSENVSGTPWNISIVLLLIFWSGAVCYCEYKLRHPTNNDGYELIQKL